MGIIISQTEVLCRRNGRKNRFLTGGKKQRCGDGCPASENLDICGRIGYNIRIRMAVGRYPFRAAEISRHGTVRRLRQYSEEDDEDTERYYPDQI